MSEKQKLLADLKQRMRGDQSLPLRKDATNLVFGNGNPDAEIMGIGEGPGFWEDKKGIPSCVIREKRDREMDKFTIIAVILLAITVITALV